ncbi:aminodeoxychorismate lyase [Rahnella woolbedingensis]|uniref:Aminodeoxychorismate lyase n=1 Tax=Rahnella woolbedingensis TaxID=1510574 RepID=A0A419N3V8_9GAMM|nr:aminodeoxychorismate lyase [Rahnella woolbedingensis]RJT38915.1 aminodeoxychorismate lyase [Rahnella woolbedingensis]
MWINGVAATTLPAADRSVQFGDGCFTTARVLRGEIQFLSEHIARMQRAVSVLHIDGVDWAAFEREMVLAAGQQEEAVVKAVVTRGQGGRGYSSAGCSEPTRIVSVSAYPVHYHAWRQQGVKLALSPVTLSKNPLLAGIKHLNRLEQVMIRLHLDQTDAQEALVVDTSGCLVECCAANLFWRKGNQVFTPDLSQSGVDGVMRQHIIRLIENASPWTLHIVSQPADALSDADEVLICNALMPVLPVAQVDDGHYSSRDLYDFLFQSC